MQPQPSPTIVNLEVETIIGVNPPERISPQKLQLKLEILSTAYSEPELKLKLCEYVLNEQPFLIETLALTLANRLIKYLPLIGDFSLTIEKPAALSDAACSFVSIFRKGWTSLYALIERLLYLKPREQMCFL